MKKIIKIKESQLSLLKESILNENMGWKMGSRKALPLKERNAIKSSLKTLTEDEVNISEFNKIIEKYDHALSLAEGEIFKLKETINRIM